MFLSSWRFGFYFVYTSFKTIQNDTRIAGFGSTTKKAIEDAGLVLNIAAPSKENPSMISAIEDYIKVVNK